MKAKVTTALITVSLMAATAAWGAGHPAAKTAAAMKVTNPTAAKVVVAKSMTQKGMTPASTAIKMKAVKKVM